MAARKGAPAKRPNSQHNNTPIVAQAQKDAWGHSTCQRQTNVRRLRREQLLTGLCRQHGVAEAQGCGAGEGWGEAVVCVCVRMCVRACVVVCLCERVVV